MKIHPQAVKPTLSWFCLLLLITYITVHRSIQATLFTLIMDSNGNSGKSQCSLDNIDICQARGPGTNGTLVYAMAGSAGFGSEINILLLAFAYSVTTRRQFFINGDRWNYGSFHDYFDIGTKHYDRSQKYQMLTKNAAQNKGIQHLYAGRNGPALQNLWSATKSVQKLAIKRKVGQYLWRHMTKNLLRAIHECKTNRTHGKYIGIHVRRGDKIPSMGSIPLAKYVDAIKEKQMMNVTLPIFVASDDRTMVDRLRTLKPDWTFFTASLATIGNTDTRGHSQKAFNRLSKDMKRIELEYLVCEIQSLIDAEVVFCGMLSNICRLAQVLREQPEDTLISLDRPWYAMG